LPYVTQLLTGGDRVIDQPTSTFPDEATYYATVYAKAALAFSAIRETVGHDAFVDGLRNYAAKSRFTVASPDELFAALEGASTGNLDDLWQRWLTSAGGHVEIVMGSGTATPAATPAAAVQP
jgi:aminopeptidase N